MSPYHVDISVLPSVNDIKYFNEQFMRCCSLLISLFSTNKIISVQLMVG